LRPYLKYSQSSQTTVDSNDLRRSRVPRGGGARRLDRALAGFRRSADRPDRVPPRSRHLEGEQPVSQDELGDVVHEYRHVHEDHRRAPPRSRVRRELEVRLHEVRGRFEHLLAEAPVSEAERRRWRDRLRGRVQPAPSTTDVRPLLFRGRSETGTELCLAAAPDGTIEAIVDGTTAAVFDDAPELTATTPGLVFAMDGLRFRETFGASPKALGDLRAALQGDRRPRREHIRELIEDGLIDRNLGLTARGRRALALDDTRPRATDIGVTPVISTRGRISKPGREHLAHTLSQVALMAPRHVIRITASLTRHEDPALPLPVVAKASMTLNGCTVRAHGAAGSESEAIALVESRLRRKLHILRDHDLAERREPRVSEPGKWRHGDLPA
jgi:hypothetical protein